MTAYGFSNNPTVENLLCLGIDILISPCLCEIVLFFVKTNLNKIDKEHVS